MRTARLIRAEQAVLAAARMALSAESRSVAVWVSWIRAAKELRAAELEAYGSGPSLTGAGPGPDSPEDDEPTNPDLGVARRRSR